MAASTILFLLFTLSLALDISIISHAHNHDQLNWRSDEELMAIYEGWLVKRQKLYNGLGEKDGRFKIFKDNLKFIDEHNAQNRTYKLGLNTFADLTNEEYPAMYLGKRTDAKRRVMMKARNTGHRYAYNAGGDMLPVHVDWRLNGAVNPIKDQKSCGICWAFSTVATVEAINKLVTGKRVPLSVHKLVDCDRSNNGCNGGLMDKAFKFIIRNGGVDTEDDHPYLGLKGKCDPARKSAKVVNIDGYEEVPPFNENALKKAVAHQPLSVATESSGRALQLYQSGVFTGDQCGADIDHAVVVVGYGTENGVDYWLVRNSWGSGWGEDGYFKIERNVLSTFTGKCGIAMMASYPLKNANLSSAHANESTPVKIISSA